ncbi:MAG: stage II sporulation protein M [Candidatus Aenigmarchaeota archaeon]|nr:stage II sporulation protein M [Candidatus Aenigmarchaeota archaeon]
MVLEALFSAETLENKPRDMFILSFIVTLVVTFLSYYIFPTYAGIIIPLLVTVSMTPLVRDIFIMDEISERKQAKRKISKTFWDRHDETIKILTFFFLGSFAAIFLLMLVLPADMLSTIFEPQIIAIQTITGSLEYSLTGAAITQNAISKPEVLSLITMNNLKVVAFSFILSFLFSTGSLFILSWNASILAIFIGILVRKGLFTEALSAAIGILPHAPVEIVAYFLAAIAGGILSVGIMREKWGSKELNLVVRDAIILIVLAIIATLVGAGIEVYI